jgi:hypothetical protein
MRRSALSAALLLSMFVGAHRALALDKAVETARDATIDVDTSEVPEMAQWGEQAKNVAKKWYPILVTNLPGEGFSPPDHVTITIKKEMDGVAYTAGNHIVCASSYFKNHTDDLGAIVHEMVHVVQQYKGGKRPGWIVEGIADYERFYFYEPVSHRPHPNPQRSTYHDSYRTSGAFLDWIVRTYDPKFVVKLNDTLRHGKYEESIFEKSTGKSLEVLGEEWKKSLGKKVDAS